MNCTEARPLLDAYFDSELDLTAALQVEQHVAECSACSGVLTNLERLREELTPEVFDRRDGADLGKLKASIRGLQKRPKSASAVWTNRVVWVAMAAALAIAVFLPASPKDTVREREYVDNHIRSLMADHLFDVPSSDQHTVKPWFQGKVDFAPAVPDLSAQGFTLTGGRLDVVNSRPVAVVVYKRRAHWINVSTTKEGAKDDALRFSVIDGFQVGRWTSGGLDHWVVSDLNRAELQQFVELYRK